MEPETPGALAPETREPTIVQLLGSVIGQIRHPQTLAPGEDFGMIVGTGSGAEYAVSVARKPEEPSTVIHLPQKEIVLP